MNGHKKTVLILLVLCNCLFMSGQSNDTICSTASHKLIEPFLGEWDEDEVTDSTEVYLGRLTTRFDVNNCAVTQRFKAPNNTFSYLSHGYVNPESGLWEETFVFSTGSFSKFLWIVDGETTYLLRVGGTRKTNAPYRLRYVNITKDRYDVISEQSNDGGKTWEILDFTKIERVDQ